MPPTTQAHSYASLTRGAARLHCGQVLTTYGDPVSAVEDENYLYGVMRGRDDPTGLAQDVAIGVIDIGHDVKIMFTTRQGSDDRIGLIESHRAPDGRECGGSVTFDVPGAEGLPGPRWTLHSLDPLHIEPSILCSCGHHGWIRGGRWCPA